MLRTVPILLLLASFAAPPSEVSDSAANGQKKIWRNPKDDMEFVWIPPGSLPGRGPGQKTSTPTTRGVSIEVKAQKTYTFEGFWLGRTEVTVRQFRRFVAETGHVTAPEKAGSKHTWRNPGHGQSENHPVVWLSYDDALAYTRWAGVDLPTEAEWLYASRAGASTRFYFGDEVDSRYVWHRENSPRGTHPVGRKRPNAWGLYDMIGNAYEWCKLELLEGITCDKIGYVYGGSWNRCPDRVRHDLPWPPSGCPLSYAWDDDRGFRCIQRDAR
jgi:formylglycine-generating enzyme required for sulfatase activity